MVGLVRGSLLGGFQGRLGEWIRILVQKEMFCISYKFWKEMIICKNVPSRMLWQLCYQTQGIKYWSMFYTICRPLIRTFFVIQIIPLVRKVMCSCVLALQVGYIFRISSESYFIWSWNSTQQIDVAMGNNFTWPAGMGPKSMFILIYQPTTNNKKPIMPILWFFTLLVVQQKVDNIY